MKDLEQVLLDFLNYHQDGDAILFIQWLNINGYKIVPINGVCKCQSKLTPS